MVSLKKIKLPHRRILVACGIIVLGILLYIFRGNFIAAMVNGQAITRSQLTKELEKRYGKDVLQNLIEQTLIREEAKKQGIKISQDVVEKQIRSIEDTLKSQNMTLADALAARGLSMNDLIDQIRLQKTVEALLGKNINISDSDIQNYFTQNKEIFGKDANFDGVKEQIRQQLLQQKLGGEYQKWIADLKAKARIDYFVKF